MNCLFGKLGQHCQARQLGLQSRFLSQPLSCIESHWQLHSLMLRFWHWTATPPSNRLSTACLDDLRCYCILAVPFYPATPRTQSQHSPPRQLTLSRRCAVPARAPPSFFGVHPTLFGNKLDLQFGVLVLPWMAGFDGSCRCAFGKVGEVLQWL